MEVDLFQGMSDAQHAFGQGACWGLGNPYTFTREEEISAGTGSLSPCGTIPCAPSIPDDGCLVLELRLEHPGD